MPHVQAGAPRPGNTKEVEAFLPSTRTGSRSISEALIESIAATDDTLLERYLGGEEIGREEAIQAMKTGMARGELFPLFCGAAELTYGTKALLSKMVELLPSPRDRPWKWRPKSGGTRRR